MHAPAASSKKLPVLVLGVLALVVALLVGCGTDPGPTAPVGAPPLAGSGTLTELDSLVVGEDGLLGLTWTLVGGGLVTPLLDATIGGSRYELEFPSGSVTSLVQITIHEHDPNVADVEFGPDGTQFAKPVRVTISYEGTALDPASDAYLGIEPAAFHFNPRDDRWEPLPCTVDHRALTVSFEVTHFSRYGLTDATLEGEWQWDRTGRPGRVGDGR